MTRLGQTLLMLDRREEAAQQFRAAISLNGSNTAARQGLCDALGGAEREQLPPACSRAQAVRVALGSSTAPYRRPVQPPCAVDKAPAVLVSENIATASPL